MATPADTSIRMTHRQVLAALSGLLLAMFVSMIATTVISTSLPVIVPDLGGDQAVYTWVVTATLLTTAISTPIWGKLADLFDRKLLMQLAIVLFVLATAACGFAQDPATLIAFRAIQGLGGGGLLALSQVLLADIISPRERGRYMGLFSAVMALATVGGPLLGGFITDAIGWRWNFFVSLPFAVGALILLQKTLHIRQLPKRTVSIDYLGIALLAASVSLLLIWITGAGSAYEWWSRETLFMAGGSVLAGAAFILVELRVREPLIPLGLFRDRTFTLSVIASAATGVALFGGSVYLAQYMQLARGATPTQAGLMTVPMIVGMLVTATGVGMLITRYGRWKGWLIAGAALLTAGTALLSTVEYDTNFALVSLYMLFLGAGIGTTMQNLTLIVQNTARPADIGVTTAAVTFFRNIAGTAGVAAMGAAVASTVSNLFVTESARLSTAIEALGERGPDVAASLASGVLPEVRFLPEGVRVIVEDFYAQGISQAFLIAVPFAVISVIAILFLPNIPLGRMTTTEKADAEAAMVGEPALSPATGSIPVIETDAAPQPEEPPHDR